ncbi:MAG: TatD family hydrolase [bacterium]|nr:TatD family hydrolase [candidate division KSB1 bacterium]MDH7561151.1 TatD family hydrolase [bacterium]
MELIDTHAHLDFPELAEDVADVTRRAREVGVVSIVNVGVDLASSLASVRLAEKYEGVYAAVGIHPHDAATARDEALRELRTLARHPKVVAVGEIGLDYYRGHSPRDVQRQVFGRLLSMAADVGLPVIIHTRQAWDDVLAAVREVMGDSGRGVFHCFSGGIEGAREVLAMGFHVSFTGVLTFKNARAGEVLAHVPLERLLLETDCPFMAPEPHRGRRNEPAYVHLIAQKVADVLGVPLAEVAQRTTENARRLFGFAGGNRSPAR